MTSCKNTHKKTDLNGLLEASLVVDIDVDANINVDVDVVREVSSWLAFTFFYSFT